MCGMVFRESPIGRGNAYKTACTYNEVLFITTAPGPANGTGWFDIPNLISSQNGHIVHEVPDIV
jgi:hypothetical protein